MAGGKAHAAGSVVAAVTAGTIAGVLVHPLAGALAAHGGLSGILISPDLDVDGLTFSEWAIARTPFVGWLLAPVFIAVWLPYALWIPHRSPLSHWPILGTAGRLAYMALIVSVPAWHFDWSVDWSYALPHLVMWSAGLALSDVFHWIMDGMPT